LTHQAFLSDSFVSVNQVRRIRKSRSSSEDSNDSTSTTASSNTQEESSTSSDHRQCTKNRRKKRGRRQRPKMSKTASSHVPNHDFGLSLLQQNEYVALDCEMVGVGPRGHKSAVAHVCVVNWWGATVLNCHIQTREPVTDYRTFVSGVTADDLKLDNVDCMTFEDCRSLVQSILHGKILVGHALKNDLHALDINHPWYDTRDTAKYKPYMKKADHGSSILLPRKLKELTKERLHRDIQQVGNVHSPMEDAIAAFDLYKLAYAKWEKVMKYNKNRTQEIMDIGPVQ